MLSPLIAASTPSFLRLIREDLLPPILFLPCRTQCKTPVSGNILCRMSLMLMEGCQLAPQHQHYGSQANARYSGWLWGSSGQVGGWNWMWGGWEWACQVNELGMRPLGSIQSPVPELRAPALAVRSPWNCVCYLAGEDPRSS